MNANRRTISFALTLLVAGFFAVAPQQADAKLADCTIAEEFHEFDCPFIEDSGEQGSNDNNPGDEIEADDGAVREGAPIHSRDDERNNDNDETPRRR